MMNYNTLFEIELKKIIEEEILKACEAIGNGSAADFNDYKMQVGKVKGLKLVLDYCEEVKTTLSRR
jgi:hypothetical protein